MTNKKIIGLVDYKNVFGSKHFSEPYRGGMKKAELIELFKDRGFELIFEYLNEVDFCNKSKYSGINVIYTSSEDIGYHYKSYIEDIVLGLERIEANIIPRYEILRAHNNKVYMETLRNILFEEESFQSKHFGSLKDLLLKIDTVKFPAVFKRAEGSSGKGVFLAKDKKDLIAKVKKIKNYNYPKEDFRDYIRSFIHKGYQKESIHRKKFILQPFIPNLVNDWKVYVFGKRLYVFKRPIFKQRGFRASGGGYDNYVYGLDAKIPEGFCEFAYNIYNKLDIPHASLDIAYDGRKYYLFEFQGLYFGTAGIPYSSGYYTSENGMWTFIKEKYSIEKVYCDSIVDFIEK
jgi:glutathione synthase/RimK-type ligase-like ATP-grasp enzyme